MLDIIVFECVRIVEDFCGLSEAYSVLRKILKCLSVVPFEFQNKLSTIYAGAFLIPTTQR